MKTTPVFAILLISLIGCQAPVRDCNDFHDGSFTFTALIDGEEHTTNFSRNGDLEISEYLGKIDSASVRWINDCEYILKNIHPNNREEEKSLHLKILTTSKDSYTFEYGEVGASNKSRGVAYKTK